MIKLKVFSNYADAVAFCAGLGDKLAPEMSKALNRALAGIKTDAIRSMVKDHGVEQSEAKEDWNILRSSSRNLEGKTTVYGTRPGLEAFSPNPAGPMMGVTTGGVTVNIRGTVARLPKAFMGLKTTNPTRVLRREKGDNPKSRNKEKRYRLNHLTARSIPQVADDEDVTDTVVAGAEKRFVKQLDHLVDRLIQEHK